MRRRSRALAKAKQPKLVEAFTVVRDKGGWQAIRMTVDLATGASTVVEKSKSDMKPIATEQFRVWVGKYWGKLDDQG